MKIHDFDSEKKTVVNANAMIELVQSGPLFATYTVDLVADPFCIAQSKGISTGFDIGSVPTSLVSGTFGPMSNSKLNLSIPNDLDLTGRDFCVVISNDRRMSNSVTDAAKANLVVRFDIRHRQYKGSKFLYDISRRPVVMTLSFIVGFALVFVPLAVVSNLSLIDNMKNKKKGSVTSKLPDLTFNRHESCCSRIRGREQPKMHLVSENDEVKQEFQPACDVDGTEGPSSQLPATNSIDNEPVLDITEASTNQKEEIHDDKETCSVSNDINCEQLTEEPNVEYSNQQTQRLNANDDGPMPLTGEAEDDVSAEPDYLLI
jgi:hypothetical protein